MAIAKSVLGLQKALRVHTGEGNYVVDPSQDPQGYNDLLGRSYDARLQQTRTAEDERSNAILGDTNSPEFSNEIQAANARMFNRGREDMATGPAGYNRQWTGFLEAPRVLADNTGMRVDTDLRGSGLSTEVPIDRSGESGPYGAFGTSAQNLANLSLQQKKPLPESHEAFMSRLAKKYGKL